MRSLSRKHLLVAFGIATVAFDVALIVIDKRLEATGGPGIVPYELSGGAGRASRILAEWGDHGRGLASLSLWLDFGFILSYATFFALAGLATRDYARDHGLRRLAAAGTVAPFLAIAAGVFDVVEDVGLLLFLGGHGGSAAPVIASVCAGFKFALIALAIGYAIWGLAARLMQRRAARPGAAP